MKREGRQHGMVETYGIISLPNWNQKLTNRLLPSTAGPFTKVSQKPTNHSKYTTRCGGSHIHPKDKTKGALKLKSRDVATNHRLLTWRVVDARPGFNFTGFSATGILDHLANDYYSDDGDEIDDNDDVDDNDDDAYDYYSPPSPCPADADWIVDSALASTSIAIEELADDFDDDEKMSFCDVGVAWKQAESDDEDWCLVEEI